MKTSSLSIDIEFSGVKSNITALVDEANIQDVMSVDAMKYLMENEKAIVSDFQALMLLRCANKIFENTMDLINNAQTSDN